MRHQEKYPCCAVENQSALSGEVHRAGNNVVLTVIILTVFQSPCRISTASKAAEDGVRILQGITSTISSQDLGLLTQFTPASLLNSRRPTQDLIKLSYSIALAVGLINMDSVFRLLSWQEIAATTAAYFVTLAVYRLVFHPLAKFPGPKLAAITRYYEAYYDIVQNGQYDFQIAKMHKKYGKLPCPLSERLLSLRRSHRSDQPL